MTNADPTCPDDRTVPDRGSWHLAAGLAAGHGIFHWITQSFVVILPEIQQAFSLTGLGVGGILSVRELATGLVKLPGGVLVDALWKHRGLLLSGCLLAAASGTLVMDISPGYTLLVVGMSTVAIAHSIWHLPASASLSELFSRRRGTVLAVHGVGGGTGDVLGPLATGTLLLLLAWRQLLGIYAAAALVLGTVGFRMLRNLGNASDQKPPTRSR